jgi:hypothetical protein
MTNCPECGKPLKKSGRKAKYCCENDSCSVIFVRHPDKPGIVEVIRKADASAIVCARDQVRVAVSTEGNRQASEQSGSSQ